MFLVDIGLILLLLILPAIVAFVYMIWYFDRFYEQRLPLVVIVNVLLALGIAWAFHYGIARFQWRVTPRMRALILGLDNGTGHALFLLPFLILCSLLLLAISKLLEVAWNRRWLVAHLHWLDDVLLLVCFGVSIAVFIIASPVVQRFLFGSYHPHPMQELGPETFNLKFSAFAQQMTSLFSTDLLVNPVLKFLVGSVAFLVWLLGGIAAAIQIVESISRRHSKKAQDKTLLPPPKHLKR